MSQSDKITILSTTVSPYEAKRKSNNITMSTTAATSPCQKIEYRSLKSQVRLKCPQNCQYRQYGEHFHLAGATDFIEIPALPWNTAKTQMTGHQNAPFVNVITPKHIETLVSTSTRTNIPQRIKEETPSQNPTAQKFSVKTVSKNTTNQAMQQSAMANNTPACHDYFQPYTSISGGNVYYYGKAPPFLQSNTTSHPLSPVICPNDRGAAVIIRPHHSRHGSGTCSHTCSYSSTGECSGLEMIRGEKQTLPCVPVDTNGKHWIDDQIREGSVEDLQQERLQIWNMRNSGSCIPNESWQVLIPEAESCSYHRRPVAGKIEYLESIKEDGPLPLNRQTKPRGEEVESNLPPAQVNIEFKRNQAAPHSNFHDEFRESEPETSVEEGKCGQSQTYNLTIPPMCSNRRQTSEEKSSAETIRSESNPNSPGEEGAPVYINLYDMWQGNNWVRSCGCAMYHSGVEVYGLEVAYGGRDSDRSGVYFSNPKNGCDQQFSQSLEVGKTLKSWNKIVSLVMDIKDLYRANEYDILYWNCHDFTQEFVKILIPGWKAPKWLNRLAQAGQFLDGWSPKCCHCWPDSYEVQSAEEDFAPVLGEQKSPESKKVNKCHSRSSSLGSSKYLPVHYISKQKSLEMETRRLQDAKNVEHSANTVITPTKAHQSKINHVDSRATSAAINHVATRATSGNINHEGSSPSSGVVVVVN